jgi:hypothetical protein
MFACVFPPELPMPAIDAAPSAPTVTEQTVDAFDLRQMRAPPPAGFSVIRPRCPEGKPGEIVVCAPDPEQERLPPLSTDYSIPDGPPRARLDIGGVTSIDVHLDSASMPDGSKSQRVMVGVKRKF